MPKPAQSTTTTTTDDLLSPQDSICPVCKSSRYLNPQMKFLVNPECYHKMCSSCVERIFSHGPAPCPIAGCKKTLRRQRFRKQTFEDIAVEREVDIRRRVADVFNRREDEFDSLEDWNNYLEMVETVTFELVSGIDVAENERKLSAYKDANQRSIRENARMASDETASQRAMEAAEREQAKIRREAARRQAEEERQIVEEERRQILEEIAAAGDSKAASEIAREGEIKLKKRLAKTSSVLPQRPLLGSGVLASVDSSNGTPGASATATSDDAGFVIKGLKQRKAAEPEKAYDPFGGMGTSPQFFTQLDSYSYPWLDKARTDPMITAGGFSVAEYAQRALVDAFAGLDVFIGDEGSIEEARDKEAATIAAVGASAPGAPITAGAGNSDDVF